MVFWTGTNHHKHGRTNLIGASTMIAVLLVLGARMATAFEFDDYVASPDGQIIIGVQPDVIQCSYRSCSMNVNILGNGCFNKSQIGFQYPEELDWQLYDTQLREKSGVEWTADENISEKTGNTMILENDTYYEYTIQYNESIESADDNRICISNGDEYSTVLNFVIPENMVGQIYKFNMTFTDYDTTETTTLDPYFYSNGIGFNGTFYGTLLNVSGFVQLNTTYTYNGYYTQTFDAGGISNWTNISYTEGLPYKEELPNNQAIETVKGGINMSGNILLYHFDEATNQTIVDYSGYGKNASLGAGYSVDWQQSGLINYSFKFNDATANRLILSDSVEVKDDKPWVVAFWVNHTKISTINSHCIYGNLLVSGNRSSFCETPDVSGNRTYQLVNEVGDVISWTFNTTYPANNTWYFLVISCNGSNSNNIELFINGESKGLKTLANSELEIRAIGNLRTTGGGWQYIGLFDEFAVFNRSLTSTEILNLYKRGILDFNISVRSCNTSNCSDRTTYDQTFTNGNQRSLTVPINQYFQYNATFQTSDLTYTPELWNVTITYESATTTTTTTTIVAASFVSQTPADIDTFNTFGIRINVTYNITGDVNVSSVTMYYMTNSSYGNCWMYINGTLTCGFQTLTGINSSTFWSFSLLDNQIYPATYNINETHMESTAHIVSGGMSNNNVVKIQLLNVSNSTLYNIFEIMANSTAGAVAVTFFYCNSSYTTGQPASTSSCYQFNSLSGRTTFNHTHSNYSSHQVITMVINTTSGTVGTIKITPVSYFVLRGANNWNYYYISDSSRVGAIETSINGGNTYTPQTFTVNSHLHQFTGNDTFTYFVRACDNNGTCTNSTVREDLIQLAGLAPTSPNVYNPANQTYVLGNISINYTAAESPNGYPIVTYNISLLNADLSFNRTIIANNYPSLGYLFDISNVGAGSYVIRVQATDSQNQTSIGLSGQFTVFTHVSVVVYSPQQSGRYNTTDILIQFTATSSSSISALWYYNETKNVTYGIPVFITVGQGNHTFIFYANDTSGNWNSISVSFSIDSIPPNITVYSPQSITYYGIPIAINFTATDANGVSSTWYNNGTANIPFSVNASINIQTSGNYTFTFNANDTYGNTGTVGVNFTLLFLPPTISNCTMSNTSTMQNDFMNVTCNLTDLFNGLTNYWITVNLYHQAPTTVNNTFMNYINGYHTEQWDTYGYGGNYSVWAYANSSNTLTSSAFVGYFNVITTTTIPPYAQNQTNIFTQQLGWLERIYYLLLDSLEVQTRDVDHYNIQVSTSENFTTIDYNRFTSGSDFKIDELVLQNGIYYSRVRTYSADTKHYGGWSWTLRFSVNGTVQ